MTSGFLTVAGPIILAVGFLVVGLFLGTMIGRRSMKKHLEAAPMQFRELSERLDAALETSEKWQNASEKWQSASESWQTASHRFEETTESLKEVIRLKDVALEAKDRTIAAHEQEIETYRTGVNQAIG
jgi:transposase